MQLICDFIMHACAVCHIHVWISGGCVDVRAYCLADGLRGALTGGTGKQDTLNYAVFNVAASSLCYACRIEERGDWRDWPFTQFPNAVSFVRNDSATTTSSTLANPQLTTTTTTGCGFHGDRKITHPSVKNVKRLHPSPKISLLDVSKPGQRVYRVHHLKLCKFASFRNKARIKCVDPMQFVLRMETSKQSRTYSS